MASFGGNNSERPDSIRTDAVPESLPRVTREPSRVSNKGATEINIGQAENVAIGSNLTITKQINKSQNDKKALGIFWDIQNCSVPQGKSVLHLIQNIRRRFATENHTEREFMCVCDTSKESTITMQDLIKGNVTVQHVEAGLKNAADDILKRKMINFADTHPAGSRLVIISCDIDFAGDLAYCKNTKNHEVVLVHKSSVNAALLPHTSSQVLYTDLTNGLPDRDGHVVDTDIVLVVTGYKLTQDFQQTQLKESLGNLIRRWQDLGVNCGGKFSIIKFADIETANEVKGALQNEKVNGHILLFHLLEESEHKDTIQKMMAKNKRGGGDMKDNSGRPTPQKTLTKIKVSPTKPMDISTDQLAQQDVQPLTAPFSASQRFQEKTIQFMLRQAGIFWDMATCPVPSNSTVQDVIAAVRQTCIGDDYSEAELICFYDVLKAGVTLDQLQDPIIKTVHIFMDAAPIIEGSLMKFAEMIPPRSRIVLISNNPDYHRLLNFYKNVKKIETFLIHVNIDSPALDRSVSKCFTLEEIIEKDDDASADNA